MLSVVIITYNEEKNIANCINSVNEIADEIYILDSFSTDNTVEIAKSMGARVEQHIFDGHIEQKNRAKNNAKYEYVLSLDADEKVSKSMLDAIRIEKENNFPLDGYIFHRLNYYCNKPIKTCGWYPDKKLRLWNKNKGNWGGKNPHDKFILNEECTQKTIAADILHNTYPNYESMKKQAYKFAEISAQHLAKKNLWYIVFKIIFGPMIKFITSYFFKFGFTDGKFGLQISYWQSREMFLKYWKALKIKING